MNPSKELPEKIKKTDKKFAEKFNYDEVEFPVREKDLARLK